MVKLMEWNSKAQVIFALDLPKTEPKNNDGNQVRGLNSNYLGIWPKNKRYISVTDYHIQKSTSFSSSGRSGTQELLVTTIWSYLNSGFGSWYWPPCWLLINHTLNAALYSVCLLLSFFITKGPTDSLTTDS